MEWDVDEFLIPSAFPSGWSGRLVIHPGCLSWQRQPYGLGVSHGGDEFLRLRWERERQVIMIMTMHCVLRPFEAFSKPRPSGNSPGLQDS